jgi:hypothetical protein
MRTWIPCLLLLAAAAAVGGSVAAQEQELPPVETRVFDVSALVAPVSHARLEPFGLSWPDTEIEEEELEPFSPLEIDALVDMIRESIDIESWEREDVALAATQSGQLLVRQTKPALDRIEQYLEWLDRTLRRPIDIAVHWMVLERESVERLRKSGLLDVLSAGTLDEAQVRALRLEADRPGNVHESGSTTSVLGNRAAVRRATFVTYLEDYDVEIAQAAQIGDPIVATAREGLEAYVRPHPLVGGNEIAVQVLARTGRLERPMPTVELEAEELGTLDLPEMWQTTLGVSGVVRNGRALVATVRSPHESGNGTLGVLLVTPRRGAAAGAPPAGLPEILDVSFLGSAPECYVQGWSEGIVAGQSPKLLSTEMERPLGIEESVEVIRMSVDPESWDEEGVFISCLEPGQIWMKHDARRIAASREVLARFEAPAKRTVQVDVSVYSVPAASLHEAALTTGAHAEREGVLGSIRSLNGAREIRGARLGTIIGRWATLKAGLERNYVHDYEVEVAQEARIADPVIGQVFAGLLLNVLPRVSPDGQEATLRLGMRLARVDAGFLREPIRPRAAMSGVLHQPRERAFRYNGTVRVPAGGCHVMDAGADDDDDRRLLVVFSARW